MHLLPVAKRTLLGVVTILIACSKPDADAAALLERAGPDLVASRMVAELPETLDDTLGLHLPDDVAAVEDGYWVTDTGNDRVIRYARDLTPVSVLGRSGEGPGEFEAPLRILRSTPFLAVSEMSNARVSLFDPAGAFQGSIPVRVGASAVVDENRTLFQISSDPRYYVERIDPSGERLLIGRTGVEDGDEEGTRTPLISPLLLALTDDGHLQVLDERTGTIHALDRDGGELAAFRIPPEVWEPLVQARAELLAAFAQPGARLASGVVKRMRAITGNRLLLLLPGTDTFALMVNMTDGTFRSLRVAEDARLAEPARSASAATIDSAGYLVLIRGGALYRFALEEAP